MPNNESHFLLTIDVEDWFQVENFKSVIPYHTWKNRELRVERNTCKLLDLFDEFGTAKPANQFNESNQSNSKTVPQVRCTFFILGWIAKRLPHLVREIYNRGHEVASHGYDHELCNKQSLEALKKDLSRSKDLLENIIGADVDGYRAPSFSVNNNVLKAVEDAGYRYDSSYNSFEKNNRYGRLKTKGFQPAGIAYKISHRFFELPISNLKICNQKAPWGGGGYFRLIPNAFFKRGIRSILTRKNAYLFYMHPWEIDPFQPRVRDASVLFKFRHYLNLHKTETRLKKMILGFKSCRFVTCSEYIGFAQDHKKSFTQRRKGAKEKKLQKNCF